MHHLWGAAAAAGCGGCVLAVSVVDIADHDNIIPQMIVLVTVDRQLSSLIADVAGVSLEII
jgi:hypothetical protein